MYTNKPKTLNSNGNKRCLKQKESLTLIGAREREIAVCSGARVHSS